MHCPYCGNRESEVVETRDNVDLNTIRRRRACLQCVKRFTTYERIENVYLLVIKRDGKREQFNREKVKTGMVRACEKTSVSLATIEKIISDIERELRCAESIEVKSDEIGEIVASKLKLVDKVAYIRFSSVFKHFVAVEDFENEMRELQ